MTQKIAFALAFLTGLAMIFLGTRFFLSPEAAEAAYGIHFNEQGDYSFHYIKGTRDIFSGLLLCAFVLLHERRALGLTLLAGTLIPLTDMLIVLSKSYNTVQQAMPHIMAIVMCLVCGIIILVAKPANKKPVTGRAHVKLIESTNKESVLEFNILPGEKTPWHYRIPPAKYIFLR